MLYSFKFAIGSSEFRHRLQQNRIVKIVEFTHDGRISYQFHL